jgi:hypothetical protein
MGSGPSPSPEEFPSHCHFYQLSLSWLLGMCHHSCLLQPACLFTFHVGSGPSPSPVEFSSHHHFYRLSRSWLLGGCHCSCLVWLACLFTVLWVIAPPPFNAQGALPSLLSVFFFCCLLFSFFSFFPGWGWSDLGVMLIWPRVV